MLLTMPIALIALALMASAWATDSNPIVLARGDIMAMGDPEISNFEATI